MNHDWSRQQQKGVGMTEILVAMVLLGIGVIGFAGLQVRALGASNGSSFRMQAMAVAADLSERIRANRSTAALAVYRPATPSTWVVSSANLTACEGASASCTPAVMAAYDMSNIAALAAATLPNGRVSMRVCEGRTNSCIYVSWNDTTPTVGSVAPHCVTTAGLYVTAVSPSATDCIISEI